MANARGKQLGNRQPGLSWTGCDACLKEHTRDSWKPKSSLRVMAWGGGGIHMFFKDLPAVG